jgi:hypothetical protein
MITQMEGKRKRENKMEKSNQHSLMVYAIFATS